ncbi:hypothetical protein CBR_g46207 [Chara braunii]|uniref:Uncharacterized protein n=1 Tax=Chara braunii TaxID=69332 RepID=A0A388M016_CHABU|nr:hypothetical protein CBR_g46207 [Chara braunii]|eukprot:GBG87908.1 hypothetical protein CBR_g46207 [Chara braunii]
MERLVDLAQKRPRDNEFQYDATGSRPGKVGRPAGSLENMAGVSGDDSVSATADLLLGNSASSGSTLGSGGLFSTFTSGPPSWNMPMNFMSEMPTPLPPPQSMPPPAASQGSLAASLSHQHLSVSASANPGGSNLALGPSGGGMDRNGGGSSGTPMVGPHSVPKRPPPNFAVPILESSRVVKLPPPQGKKAPLQLVGADKGTGANPPGAGKAAGGMGGRGDKDRQNGAGAGGGKLGPENGAGEGSGKEKGGGENMKSKGSEVNKSPLGNLKERQAAAGGFRPPARPGRRGRPPGSGRKQAAVKAAASASGLGTTVGSYGLPETRTYVLPDSPPASSYEPDPIGAPVATTSERRRKKSMDTDSQIGQLAGENIRLWEALTKTVGELAMQRDMLWRLQAEVLALRVRLDAVSTSPYSWGGPPFIGQQGGGSAPPTTTSGGPSWLRPDTAPLKGTGTNGGPSAGDGANPDGAKMGARTDISIGKNGTGAAAFSAAAACGVDNDYTLADHRNLAQGNAGMQDCEPTSMEGLQSEAGKSVREMQETKDSDTHDRGMGMGSGGMEEAKQDMDSMQAGAAATAEGIRTDGGRTESDALEQSCLGGGTGSEITGADCAAAGEFVCDEGHMQEKGGDNARFKEANAVNEAGVCRAMEERDMLERHMLEVGSNNPSGTPFEHDKEVRYNRIPGPWSKEQDNTARLAQDNSPNMDRGGSQLGLELGMNKMGVQQEVNVQGKQHEIDGRMGDSTDEDDGNRRNEGGRDVFHVDGRDMGGVESDGMSELPRELFNAEKDGGSMPGDHRAEGRMVQSGHEGCHGGGLEDAAEGNVSNRGMRSEDNEGAHGRMQIGPGLELLRNLPQRRAGQEVNEEIERGGNMHQQYRMMGVLGDGSNTPIPGHSDSSAGIPSGLSSDSSQQMDRGGRTIPMDGFSGLFTWNK